MGTLKGPVHQVSFMVPHLKVGDHKVRDVSFSSGDTFMHLCRHPRVVRHLSVLIVRVRARTVHNNDLQGWEIIVDFQCPDNSSQDRNFALLMDILIT